MSDLVERPGAASGGSMASAVHTRMPVLDGLSLAKDIDTEEEAREAERRLGLDADSAGGS